MRLKIGRLAVADVDAIFDYGLNTHGAEAAIEYLDRIEAKYRQLLDHPRSGRADPSLEPEFDRYPATPTEFTTRSHTTPS